MIAAFNQQVVQLLQELAEYCATLEHAVEQRGLQSPGGPAALAAGYSGTAELEKRLARLETLLLDKEKVRS